MRACGVAAILLLACDATPKGTLSVGYQLQTTDGTPLACENLEASQVEVTLFHLTDDVLPYHRAGLAKYERLGLETSPSGLPVPSAADVDRTASLLRGFGLTVRVGG